MGILSEIESAERHANRGGRPLLLLLYICVAFLLVPLVADCGGSDSSSTGHVTSSGRAAATIAGLAGC